MAQAPGVSYPRVLGKKSSVAEQKCNIVITTLPPGLHIAALYPCSTMARSPLVGFPRGLSSVCGRSGMGLQKPEWQDLNPKGR